MNRLLSIFAICLFHLGLFAQDGQRTEFYTSGYYVGGGEAHTAGDTRDVYGAMLNDNGIVVDSIVATLTFGVEGGNEFSEGIWDYQVEPFHAFTPGNGENGTSESGTVYTIRTRSNGYVNVGVVLNANKPFYILEDGQALADFNGLTVSKQYRGTYNFPVKAGSEYKIYAENTQLGFYGLTYLYSTDPSYVFEAHKMSVSTNAKNHAYANYSGSSIQVTGNSVWLSAYGYDGYRFKHWTANGGIISTEQYFYYTMPAHDVEIVAVFEFSPTSPGDPASAENSYKLTLESQPANAGYFNLPTTSKISAGTTTWIYPYNNRDGYVFKEWQIDGNKISSQRELEFTMPEQNVTLTAVFAFNPTNPGNPGSNRFDAEVGELVLDDFTPGNAYNAAWNATNGNMDKVKSIIFIGEVSDWDVSNVARNCQNCEQLDLTRTTGMRGVGSYAFEYCQKLTTISLPASITYFSYGAFAECTELTTLNIHAVTPPAVYDEAFGFGDEDIMGNITVFVPASALALYQQTEAYQKFSAILPFTTEVCDLEVMFPKGVNIAAYKNMSLEAYNTMSGQRLSYVITNQTVYTFSNIIRNTTWTVSLKNANGKVLGQIPEFEVQDTMRVELKDLKTLKAVTLAVTCPDETDVTKQVVITWSDDKGNFLTQDSIVKNLLDGDKVNYAIALPENLAKQYQLPQPGDYTVEAEDADIVKVTVQLVPLKEFTINGIVTDHNQNSEPLKDAVIAVSQTINGQYSKTFVTKTDAEGKWSLKVFDVPSEITASKTGYIAETQKYDALTETINPFDLRDINGVTINLTLNYKPIEGEVTTYEDAANVAYSIVNETTGEALSEMSVQPSKIVLMDKYPEGTKFAVTATSKNQKFLPQTVTAEVDDKDAANAVFTITQLGGIKASYSESDNSACVAILYDANGQLVKRFEYAGKKLTISELADGTYTLVTMGNSQLFNSVGLLSQFEENGLRNGVDYVRKNVTVVSGAYTTVTFSRVPFFDETKLYYTGENTSFSANKSQVTAGQYLTLRGQVDFKGTYAGLISNVNLVIDMTPDCEFVANSVMLGKNLTGYTLNGNQLIVPIGTSTEQVRFCVIPTKEGTYEPSASVSFNLNGKTVLQPIGSAQTTVKGVTITVPVTTAKQEFTASGTATAKSDVYVYADDLLVGKTIVKANGKWTAQCDLGDVADKTEHPVYARITTPQNAELSTDTKKVMYDEGAILAEQVGMSFYNGWLNATQKLSWNMIEKKVSQTSYMFYTTTDFTFTISFTTNNTEKISGVQLVVYKNDNTYDILDATYNDKKKFWVVSHRYSSWALPTTVKVKYIIDGVQMTQSEDADDEGNEHSNPILDPSGFVYEAVSSNRLQGVTASIYYKEEVEDEYGDKHENIVLWNAEDYAQVNPQFTDENGMYQWDVPNGLWQVRLEKEGYLKTNSEWLPVPPPQLDINLPMVQMIQPSVNNGKSFAKGVEFEFDKYMKPATLTAENISVTKNGQLLAGTIKLVNEEAAYEGAAESYATKVLFEVGEDEELTSSDVIVLTVNKAVESYAGVQMQDTYTQKFVVEPVVRNIKVDDDLDLVNVAYGQTRKVTIAALPEEAAKGKTINVQLQSELVSVNVEHEQLKLDDNGQAELEIIGELPGATMIKFTMEDSDVEGQLEVNVKDAASLVTVAPRASRVSGSQLYRGARILLSSETENAVIKFTLDGSSPAEDSESVLTYNSDEPIVITDDNVTIKAIAYGRDLEPSEVSSFNYGLKKSTVNYQMAKGWTWISHNLESPVNVADIASNVVRVVSQTGEAVNDPQYGLVGSLTELQPAIGYKVQVSDATDKIVKGFEMNANENTVNVLAGWNWIGYPLNQTMTIAEALEYFDATTGDMIVGQDGSAEYNGSEWSGSLEGFKPGQGYLFKTATTTAVQFNTNTVSDAVNLIGQSNWLIGSPWTFDKHAYPNAMPVTAEFYVDGVKCDDGEFVVAAFVGDECRGVGRWIGGRLMMNVYGDGGENVTFKAYNKVNKHYYTVAESLKFKADNEGTWYAPIALTLGNETTGLSEVNKDLLISVGSSYITVNAGGKNISSLTLTNMGGVTVLSASDLGTGATITTGSLSDGMYIVTIKAEGKTYYEKILKGNK